jgi:hypothetical protein
VAGMGWWDNVLETGAGNRREEASVDCTSRMGVRDSECGRMPLRFGVSVHVRGIICLYNNTT